MANLTQRLQIIIDAQNKAGGALSSVNKDLDKFKKGIDSWQPAFQKMALAGTVAFGAISAVAIKSVSDYAEAEKAQKQLEHAVMNVSKATREQFEATVALADALERKGVLDGDNIKMGLAQLSTFGLSNKAVQGLGQSLSDLAVNQFGVNASGEQLADTANMIAKALNMQFGVLEKSGIRFSAAQKHAIEFGTEMEKVAAINEGFAQNLKYTNDVALQTFEGRLAKVKVQLGNMSESLGKALMPALERVLTAIAPIIEKVAAWIEQNPELTSKIILFAAALAGLVAVLGTIGMVLPVVITGIQLMLGPVGLVILAITALIAIGVLLYKNWDEISAWASEKWNAIKEAITTALQAIKDFFIAIWEGIKTAFMTYVYFIAGLFDMLMDWILPGWEEGLGRIYAKWLEIWEGIKGVFTAVFGWFQEQFTALLGFFKVVWDGIIKIFNWAKDQISSVFDWISEKIEPVFKLLDKLISKLEKIGSGVKDALGSVVDKGKALLGAKASGGPVAVGHPYLVGENGPEVFTPATAGRIARGGVGGTTIVLNLSGNTFMGREGVANQIADEIMRQLQVRTKFSY